MEILWNFKFLGNSIKEIVKEIQIFILFPYYAYGRELCPMCLQDGKPDCI
jgi:hypothetical protein